MNADQLRAYAISGVTSRITALETELSELRAVLSRLQPDVVATPAREPRATPARPRAVAVARPAAVEPVVDEPVASSEIERPEPARVIARRGRLPRQVVIQEPVVVLPPMPRLVKASAS
ncbi:MAG TPA: hypothetical protein VMF13_16030 [Luteitalea sp.]|nr:hypothetical protein [Luteitalea sp.]